MKLFVSNPPEEADAEIHYIYYVHVPNESPNNFSSDAQKGTTTAILGALTCKFGGWKDCAMNF